MYANNNVMGSLFWTAVRVWGNRLSGFIIFLILARTLEPEAFGIYAAVWAVLLFIEVFCEQGLSDALIQKHELEPSLINGVFYLNILTSIMLATGVILLSTSIEKFMSIQGMALPLQCASASLILNGLAYTQFAMCRRLFKYKWLALRSLIATVASGAIGIGLAFMGYGVWSLVVQYVSNSVLNLVIIWIKPAWKPTKDFSLRGLSDLLKYSTTLLASRVLDAINTRGFEIAIGTLLGAISLGIYTIASRIQGIMIQMFGNVAMDVAHTTLSRLTANKVEFLSAYYKSLSATATISIPFFVLTAALSNPICEIIFGSKWISSGEILSMLSLLSVALCIQYLNSTAINSLGHPISTLLVSLFKTLSALSCVLLFGESTLYEFVKFYCIGISISLPINLILGKFYIGFSWKELSKCLVTPVIGGIFLYFSSQFAFASMNDAYPVLALVFGIVTGLSAYLLFVFAFSRNQIRDILSNLRRR